MTFKKGILKLLGIFVRNSPHHSISYSFTKLLSIKFGVLLGFAIDKLVVEGISRKALRGTRLLSGVFEDKVALIIANGPSANEVNWNKIDLERTRGNCSLFLINHSLNEPLMLDRGADFLVLSDPGSHPRSSDPRTINLWENIATIPGIRLITPISWHAQIGDPKCGVLECLHFSDLSLETITKSTSPLRARGYPSLTAYKALAFARHLGFKTLLIAGLDNSMFRTIRVSSDNSLIQPSNHFFENYSVTSDITALYPNGIADYFAELSEMFLSLRRCFKDVDIINLGLQSEVDAFPKATKDTIWNEYVIQEE